MSIIYDLLSITEYSYLFCFLIVFFLSVIPILTPPTWIVVVSAYALNQDTDPVFLSLISATAAISGRLILMKFSSVGRRMLNSKRKSSIDRLKNYLEQKKFGYFVGTIIFAMLPLPSNMLFVSYGLMRVKSIQVIAGFWIGRFIIYLVMIHLSKSILQSITLELDNMSTVVWIDIAGILMTLLLLFLDWDKLLSEHKLAFIKPNFRFNKSQS
ncbi:MAG: hypothetical protein DA328_07700 [Nitrososphaeraceae archaeon]|nr:hypothetical protein [Nitrososphaeraceae archaeon]